MRHRRGSAGRKSAPAQSPAFKAGRGSACISFPIRTDRAHCAASWPKDCPHPTRPSAESAHPRPRHRLSKGRLLAALPDALRLARLRYFLRPLEAQLDVRQHTGHGVPELSQHLLEESKGLALVLVERIALCISAEIDALAQMVEGQQVIFPGLV